MSKIEPSKIIFNNYFQFEDQLKLMDTTFPPDIQPGFVKFRKYIVKRIDRNKRCFDLTTFIIDGKLNYLTNSYIGNY